MQPRFERALILEDFEPLRRSLARSVRRWQAIALEAPNISTALELLKEKPDLIVLDLTLPDGRGHELVRSARELSPLPFMVAISGTASPIDAFELARLGVRVFLSKPFSSEEFAHAVEDAVQPSADVAEQWVSAMPPDRREWMLEQAKRYAAAHQLTDREAEVLRLSVMGVPRKRLAEALGVSENTCKTLVRRTLMKCNAERLSAIPRILLSQLEG